MAKKFETEQKGTFDTIIKDMRGVADKKSKEVKQDQPQPKTESKKASPGRPKKKITRNQTHKRTTLYIRNDLADFFENYLEGVSDTNFSQIVNALLDKEKSRIEKKNQSRS